jgi:hypothetical protein
MWRWKKFLSWGDVLVSLHSWFQKCKSLTLYKHFFIRKLKQKLFCMDCQSATPTSQNLPFFGKQICRLGIVDFILPSNWWVSLLQKSEFADLIVGFEKLGLELDNPGGQPITPIVANWLFRKIVSKIPQSRWFWIEECCWCLMITGTLLFSMRSDPLLFNGTDQSFSKYRLYSVCEFTVLYSVPARSRALVYCMTLHLNSAVRGRDLQSSDWGQ